MAGRDLEDPEPLRERPEPDPHACLSAEISRDLAERPAPLPVRFPEVLVEGSAKAILDQLHLGREAGFLCHRWHTVANPPRGVKHPRHRVAILAGIL